MVHWLLAQRLHETRRDGRHFSFTTLFGLLAVEIAVELKQKNPDSILSYIIGGTCFLVALVFAWRSFFATILLCRLKSQSSVPTD